MELVGTCLLLGMLFSMTVPLLLVIARERRSTEQRQFALQHAANLLEYATARQWAELVPGEQNLPEADADLQSILPGLERSLVVDPVTGELPTRRIVVSVRWQSSSGPLVSPLRLSTWVYDTKVGQ